METYEKPEIKYVNICEGWHLKIHKTKDSKFRKDANLFLCKECYEQYQKDK